MIYSKDIDDLRADAAHNCRRLIELVTAAGRKIKITNTVRDQQKQDELYKAGKGGRTVTFHKVGVGLAFDICQNVQNHLYDTDFFNVVVPIAKAIGFTWGGDWKNVDKPHFQWDEHGRFTDADIAAGRYPPEMPPYGATEAQEDEILERVTVTINGKKFDGVLIGDSTYAPLRALAEAMGYTVTWDEATKTVDIK